MMELHEIEELAKNVNRHAIKAFLRNAAILKDPAATAEMKELAAANVKAIAQNQAPIKPKSTVKKPKKVKAAAAEQATQLVQQPSTQTPAAAAPPSGASVKSSPTEFHEEFAHHHGGDPAKLKEVFGAMSPQQLAETKAWHAEKIATPKVAKSIDTLYDLFTELKKRL